MKRTDSYSYKSVSFRICDLLNKGSVWLLYAPYYVSRQYLIHFPSTPPPPSTLFPSTPLFYPCCGQITLSLSPNPGSATEMSPVTPDRPSRLLLSSYFSSLLTYLLFLLLFSSYLSSLLTSLLFLLLFSSYLGHSTEKGNFLSGGLGVRYLGFVGICEHIYQCQ